MRIASSNRSCCLLPFFSHKPHSDIHVDGYTNIFVIFFTYFPHSLTKIVATFSKEDEYTYIIIFMFFHEIWIWHSKLNGFPYKCMFRINVLIGTVRYNFRQKKLETCKRTNTRISKKRPNTHLQLQSEVPVLTRLRQIFWLKLLRSVCLFAHFSSWNSFQTDSWALYLEYIRLLISSFACNPRYFLSVYMADVDTPLPTKFKKLNKWLAVAVYTKLSLCHWVNFILTIGNYAFAFQTSFLSLRP